ncbi:odorant receptor 30a-like [Eupeodes corollae]|uniref:odorant receptor 30a-like n=1 Tax=Eupeodes corollae TaxID=290404 RepID=UPI0024902335|nr:odorant receptor 30a-like [Eupeodes corollae]
MSVQIESLPLYSMTAKILKFFAYLIDDHWRCYIFLMITLVFNLLEIIYVATSDNELAKLVINLFLVVLWLSTNMRAYVLIRNRKKMNSFLTEIHHMYTHIMKYGDSNTKTMLQECTKSARNLANFNLLLGFFTCVGMFESSGMGTRRDLIYDMYLPFYNDKKLQSPCFEILFATQFVLIPVGCCMFVPFLSLIISLVMFNIFLCKVLQIEFRSLKEGITMEVVNNKIAKCVYFHNKIISYVASVNSLSTFVFAVEYVFFGALMCVLLFLLVIVKTVSEQLIMSAYISMIFVQLSVTYFFANNLFFESLAVADAAYDTSWYEYNGKTRLKLMLIIQRAQKPICLTMGNFHPMTLEVLTTLLNFSYSYFTILRNMME